MSAARRWLKPLRYAVAVLLLVWLFSRFPLSQVGAVLARAGLPTLLLGAAAAVAAQMVASVRLALVARHHGFTITAREASGINFAAAFYGLTVPAGNLAGGAVRIFRLGGGGRPMPALAAVFADRVHATYGMLLAGSIFWLADPVARPPALGLALLGITAAVPGAYLLLRKGSPLAARLPEKWSRALGREAAIAPSETARIVGLSMVAQLFGLGAVVAAAFAVGLGVSPLTLGWVRTAVMMLVMLPITIAGFGVREGALVAVLAQYDIPGEQAVAFSLLMFALATLPNGAIGGALEAWRLLRPGRRAADPPM